jgi:quercetin dioxygenase-like cupin family protein
MPKPVPVGISFLHGVTDNRLWDLIVNVIAPISTRSVETLLLATFAITLVQKATAQGNHQPVVQKQIPLSASSSWDGGLYQSYPPGQPELSVLKIILAPHTQLEWHSHPMPSAAYILAGELTLERKRDGKRQRFTAGQAVSETVDTFHRGVAGSEPVVLIVFYAGSAGMPLTQHPHS